MVWLSWLILYGIVVVVDFGLPRFLMGYWLFLGGVDNQMLNHHVIHCKTHYSVTTGPFLVLELPAGGAREGSWALLRVVFASVFE